MSQHLEEDFLMLSMKYAASSCPASALVHCTGDSNLWSSDEAPSACNDSDWLHQQHLACCDMRCVPGASSFPTLCLILLERSNHRWTTRPRLSLMRLIRLGFFRFILQFFAGSRCLTLRRSWTSGQWWIIRYGLLCGHGGRKYIDVGFLMFTWNFLVKSNAASRGSFGFNGRSCINVWHIFLNWLWWHCSFSCSTCVTWSLLHLVFGLVCFCGSRCCHYTNYY